MNYRKIYDSLVNRAKNRTLHGYYEKHHVLPKCMGGNNDENNIVKLTPEEHYICHQLLVKIYPDNDKLIFAAAMMISNRPGNKLYGWISRARQNAIRKISIGKKNSQFGTLWITNGINDKKWKKNESIPDGWKKGRKNPRITNPPRKVTHNQVCKTCKKIFLQKKRDQKYCCDKCSYDRKRDSLIKIHFSKMKAIYEKTHSVNSAFIGVGISRNGYLAKEFLNLYASET